MDDVKEPKEEKKQSDISTDNNLRIAFQFIVTFVQSFSKLDRTRSMLIWSKDYAVNGLSNISISFSSAIVNNTAQLAIIPDVEENKWSKESMKNILTSLTSFDISDEKYEDGTGSVILKLRSKQSAESPQNDTLYYPGSLMLKFVKKIERRGCIYLLDDELYGINGKNFVRTKLFTFIFLRPKQIPVHITSKKMQAKKGIDKRRRKTLVFETN